MIRPATTLAMVCSLALSAGPAAAQIPPGVKVHTPVQQTLAVARTVGPSSGRSEVLRPAAAWGGLGLGTGGVRATQGGATIGRVASRKGGSAWTSPGGVVVQARREGVRLDLPSGVDLLVAPDGFLHVRDPKAAPGTTPRPVGPFKMGVELFLGDGIVLQVQFAAGARSGLEQAGVRAVGDEQQALLWHRGRPAQRTLRNRGFRGSRLAVLSNGEAIYRVAAVGPVMFLQRQDVAILPHESSGDAVDASHGPGQHRHPDAAVLLWGPALHGSLSLMAVRCSRHNPEYPGLEKLSRSLADQAPLLFPAGHDLMVTQGVPLRVGLGQQCRLELELPGSGGFRAPVALRLLPPAGDHPLVEWQAESAGCDLQIVRPLDPDEPGRGRNLRYFQKGLTVPAATPWPLDPRDQAEDYRLARDVLAALRGT